MKRDIFYGIIFGILACVVLASFAFIFAAHFEIVRQADYESLVDAFCEDDVGCLIELHR